MHAVKAYGGEHRHSSTHTEPEDYIVVVSLVPQTSRTDPHYLFYRQLGGAKSQAGKPKEKKNFLPLPRFEPRTDKSIV
jgi:hypothetical protein